MKLMISIIVCAILFCFMFGCIYWRLRTTLTVRLNSCYSLNKLCNLNINGRLPAAENVMYKTFIKDLLFSQNGDVYIQRRSMNRNTCWEHFSPEGERLEFLSETEIQNMLHARQIGGATEYICNAEDVNTPNQKELTIVLEL